VTWRARLREAVRRSGRKHSAIAWEAGIAPETLSRVLNAKHGRPMFETIVRITHASGHTVGWLLDERGFTLAPDQVRELRKAAKIIEDATGETSQAPRAPA
jgi:hypothetical protein